MVLGRIHRAIDDLLSEPLRRSPRSAVDALIGGKEAAEKAPDQHGTGEALAQEHRVVAESAIDLRETIWQSRCTSNPIELGIEHLAGDPRLPEPLERHGLA